MATGTSGDKRDDEITEPIGDDVDTDLDADATADAEAEAAGDELVDDEAELAAAEAEVADDADAAEVDLDADADDVVPVAAGAAPKSKRAKAEKAAVEKAPAKKAPAKKKPAAKKKDEPKGIAKFLKEVGAELRKVVTPTRKELWRYTGVVLGFLVVMMLIVMALDFFFGFVSSWVFGEGTELFPAPAPEPLDPGAPAAPDAP